MKNKHHILKSIVFFSLFWVVSTTFLFGQKNSTPKWMKSQLKQGEAIAGSETLEAAKESCVDALVQQLIQVSPEDSCLYNRLSSKYKIEFNPQPAYVKAAANSSAFKVVNKYANPEKDSTWVMVRVLPKDFSAFNDSIYQACVESGISHLVLARDLKEKGNIYSAGQEYCRALESVTPCLYFYMETDEGDLAEVLLNEYASLFDRISFKFNRKSCPMIQGEEVPLDITVEAYQNNVKLKNLPVQIWMRQSDAVLDAGKTTGKEGSAKIHISKAPKADKAKLLAAVDIDQLSVFDGNFATPLLKQHLNDSLKQFSITLESVDPTPCYYFAVDSIDSLQVCPQLRMLMGEQGLDYKEVNTLAEADVLIKVGYEVEEGMPVKTGNYRLREDLCSATITIADALSNEVLFTHTLKDFAVKSPETRSQEKVRIRAMREMIRPMVQDCMPLVGGVKYDKRKKIFKQ